MKEKLNIVIVGHIDHGKSTLIGRLLYDTDSLPQEKLDEVIAICEEQGKEPEFAFLIDYMEEERKQGITIGDSKVFFKTDQREYVIIDAPGHLEFIKNMITGASQADAALLLLDVNEGVKDQTKRHAYLLSLLGIKQVVLLLNKIDLVGYDQEKIVKVEREIKEFLIKIGVTPSSSIPISAKTGENIAQHSENLAYTGPTVLEVIASLKAKQDKTKQKLVFPLQDIYDSDSKKIAVGPCR